MRTIRHKPTLSPAWCNHCKQIWYGSFYNADNPIIPQGYVLCHHCLKALHFHLLKKDARTLQGVCETYSEKGEGQEWKKDYPQFFEMAKQWIERDANELSSAERDYASNVPKWVRNAISSGKMTPNDNYVYTITTQGDSVVQVEMVIYSEGEQSLKHGPVPLKYGLFFPPKRVSLP